MRFQVLGEPGLLDDAGEAVRLGSPNQRLVLAVLLAADGGTVSVDTLVDALWGDEPPGTAVPTLRSYVSRLRRQVGDALVTRGAGYALDMPNGDLDADRFDALVAAAASSAPDDAAEHLDEALALWRGPAYGEFADLDRIRPVAVRLEERRSSARQALATAEVAAGRAAEAVATAEALVAAEPLREPAWAVLMRALALSGRPAEALRAFQRANEQLAEAGLEPSDSLRDVEREVFDGTIAAGSLDRLPSTGPPQTSRMNPPPTRASSFVGREDDRRSVAALLTPGSVVTLLGPGGVGKTRLAIELAGDLAGVHRHGCAWVDLDSLAEDAAVGDTVVAALGVSEGRPTAEALRSAGALEALLVLDNAEHVLDGVCATLTQLIAGGALTVLVTSRERLGFDGEQVWGVAPLASHGDGAPGAVLLADRARATGRAVDDLDAAELQALLDHLDGLPLAIEMAAAELQTMSVAELVEALADRGMSPLRRGVPERHRSLGALLEWSERRLEPEERHVLAELSVLAGPRDVRDIAGALGRPDCAATVRRLAERSLVAADVDGHSVEFHLLQTVKAHAGRVLQRSGRADAAQERHARWSAETARVADTGLRGPQEGGARARIDALLAELRVALAWCRSQDPDLAAEICGTLLTWARSGTRDEPLLWAEQMLASQPVEEAPPEVLAGAAARAVTRGDLEAARTLARAAIAREGSPVLSAYDVLADVDLFEGELEAALRGYLREVEVAQEAGDRLHTVMGTIGAALAHAYRGDVDDGLALLDAVPPDPDRCPTGRAWLRYARGELLAADDPARALTELDAAAVLSGSVDSRYLAGTALISSTSLRSRVGPVDEALEQFRRVVQLWNDLGDRTHQVTTLRNLAVLLQRAERPEPAAELLGSVDAAGPPTYGEEAGRLDRVREWTRERLGDERSAELAASGAQRDTVAAAEWVLGELER